MSLYNFSVAPGENSQIPNVCASGYIKNNSSTATASFVIYSERNATLNNTLSPQQAFNFTNLYILRILNTSADSSCILDVIFSDTSAFSATESESVIQLGSLGSSLGNIPISIDAANITGNIPIEIVANSFGNIPITLAANTAGNITIDIAAQSVGNVAVNSYIQSSAISENGFNNDIAATGTAQQLTTTSTVVQHFTIRNNGSSVMYIGTSANQARYIFPNGFFWFDCNPSEYTDISTWYVRGTAGDNYVVNYEV